MDNVFNSAGKSDLTDKEDLETKESQREIDEEELIGYIKYLEELPRKYTNSIIDKTVNADYKWNRFSETLLKVHINVWEITSSRKIIQFKNEQIFIDFIQKHNIKDIFVYKELIDALSYITYSGGNDLRVSTDNEISDVFEIILNNELLSKQEEAEFKIVINKYKESIEQFVVNQNKNIIAYVEYKGSIYGMEFETDDSTLRELKFEFYDTLQEYIRHKGYEIDDHIESILNKAYNELQELAQFLAEDEEFRKCTNKQLRLQYRMSKKFFENNRFPNLHYVMNNIIHLSKKYSSAIRTIECIYSDVFEDVRRAIRAGAV